MAEKFVFEFGAVGLDRILAKVEEFRQEIRALDQEGGLGEGFERFAQEFELGATRAETRIVSLRNEIELLQNTLADPRVNVSRQVADLAAFQSQGFASDEQKTELRAALEQRILALKQEELKLETLLANEAQRLIEIKQREANLAEFTNRLESMRVNLLTQIADLKPGGSRLQELIAARVNTLLERQVQLRAQLAQESERFRKSVGREGEDILNKELDLSVKVAAARKAVAAAEQEVARAKQASEAAGLAEQDQFAGTASDEERAAALAQQVELTNQLTAAQRLEQDAIQNVATLEGKRLDNAQQLLAIESSGGAAVGASEILSRLQQINDAYAILIVNSEEALRGLVGPEFRENLDEVEQLLESLGGKEILSPDEEEKLASATVRAKELVDQFERIPEQGIPLPLNEDEIFAGMSRLNRLLLGAARDFGRRFTATLQFAMSGALLFGVQRLVREFFAAAVEVERTFADISTSLEFDIKPPRGTAAFERELEKVRRQVLQIADDFNALPTEVNAAAFQMISRFTDIDAAMIATRAQILATRIATIDQSEALRALTAVAESYGMSLASIANDQERERAQALLYAQALDYATAIQQRFGISVEDTLEGSAGLAELFRSLGFSMAETFGIVATVIRKTSVTGQVAFDRLGRSLGQITSPKTRDELLELANSLEEFTLAPADFFESGRQAFFKIVQQFGDLDSSIQNRISQIIGQRRETQFVSALLQGASQGLIDEVTDVVGESAGAAEDRLRILLFTVSGTIEGISQSFQELAQNLERLGVITPIKILLTTMEAILQVINKITKAALNVFEALNKIRINPFAQHGGLGDSLKFLLSMVTAAIALRSLLASIKLIANVRGAQTFLDIFRGVLGANVPGGKAGQLGARAGAAFGVPLLIGNLKAAEGVAGKTGTAIKTLFIGPLKTVFRTLQTAKLRIGIWTASIIANIGATNLATISENNLLIARARTAIGSALSGIAALSFSGVLAKLGLGIKFVATKGGILVGVVLQILGAFILLKGALDIVAGVIGGILGITQTPEETRAEIRERMKVEAEAAGVALSDTELDMASLEEHAKNLGEELGTLSSQISEFLLTAFIGLPGEVADVPGGAFNIARERNRAELELAFAQLDAVQLDLQRANRRAGGTRERMVPELQTVSDRLDELRAALRLVDTEANADDFNFVAGVLTTILGFKDRIPEIDAMLGEAADTLFEFGEVWTPGEISAELQAITSKLNLGKTDIAEARERLLFLREQALEGLAQATMPGKGDPDVAKDYERSLLEIGNQEVALFDQATQARLDLVSGLEDNRQRIRAELQIQLAAAKEAASNVFFGPGREEAIRRIIVGLEKELAKAIMDEATARARFNVDTALTFEDRQAAYAELIKAIKAEILLRAVERAGGVHGGLTVTAAEEAILNQVIRARADDRMKQAILIARNTTLSRASSLDNIAAIAANINALRVEIRILQDRVADDELIRSKELELRDQVAALRLAEADRRASFFRLTAGTGDEIRAAQAELRAAQDRIDTIIGLGGKDTQAAYDAELEVLRARERLADLALEQADLQRRVNSDLTNTFEQALLDVHAAQEALRLASGSLEKLRAEKDLAETEARAQREFYNRRVADLDFLFQTDKIGRSQYIAALRELQAGIDRTTDQGEQLWRDIELQIRSLMDSADQAFNIPTDIRLPTLFEVRRALEADALGVNYQDNREQQINIFVSDDVDLENVIDQIESAFGGSIDVEAARNASGGAAITIGAF